MLAADGLSLHDLAGFIGLAGVYDFVPVRKTETGIRHLFGKQPAQQQRADPMTFVHANDPPMLLLQGTRVQKLSLTRMALAQAPSCLGGPVTLYTHGATSASVTRCPVLTRMMQPSRLKGWCWPR